MWHLSEPPVPPVLRRDVLHVRVFDNPSAQRISIKVAPVALPGLVFHQKGSGPAIQRIETPKGTAEGLPLAFVYGAGTTPSTMHYWPGPHLTIQVILKPAALHALFGLDARRLRNGAMSLSELPCAPTVASLHRARGPHGKVALLFDFLATQVAIGKTRDVLVERALGLMEEQRMDLRLPRILAALGLSERQLERRFTRAVGVAPKTYVRVRRFNEALRLMKSRRYPTLASIAYALGFSDQSHFIRDLKAFSRITPKGLSQRADQFHELAGFSYEA
jgi:AraC-like DNA-binding protein